MILTLIQLINAIIFSMFILNHFAFLLNSIITLINWILAIFSLYFAICYLNDLLKYYLITQQC